MKAERRLLTSGCGSVGSLCDKLDKVIKLAKKQTGNISNPTQNLRQMPLRIRNFLYIADSSSLIFT
jgi:hypothetical protein